MEQRNDDEKRKLAQILVLIADYMEGKDKVYSELGYNGNLYKLTIDKSTNPQTTKDELLKNINWDSNFNGPEDQGELTA